VAMGDGLVEAEDEHKDMGDRLLCADYYVRLEKW
jgi:hypothetical protein